MKYILIFFIVIYIIYRAIKYLNSFFQSTEDPNKPFMNKNSGKPNKTSVDKKDIIDAEFEDIDESEKSS